VLGVGLAWMLQRQHKNRLIQQGFTSEQAGQMVKVRNESTEPTHPNWWILVGSLAFVLFTLTVGLGSFPYSEEIVFGGSMAIVLFLMGRLVQELEPDKRFTLVGTAVVVFIFRAIPGTGPGTTWWMIDQLGFDQQFLSVLSLIGSTLTLAGMFIFRRFMAERSIAYVVGFLTVIGTILALPIVSMYYGLHEWTARMTGGIVDARFIALIDTALESPLGQISMIPMLVWIANSAPANLKATFFAVMASFTNLALSLSQLGTKYLNDIFVVTREVRDQASGAIQTQADYSELGPLLIMQLVLGLALPFTAILFAKLTRFKSA
jgi:BT1 family protein